MRHRTWKARVKKVLAEEMDKPEQWFYVSFADEQFNGAVIIRGHGVTDIVMKCHAQGINPGGQVAAWPMPEAMLPDEKYRNRLLTKADVTEIWPDAKSIREHEVEVTR